jgi:hypothetical protein
MLIVRRAVKSIVNGTIKHGKSMTRDITTAPTAPVLRDIKESSTINPAARGADRRFGPLKASLNESNRHQLPLYVEGYGIGKKLSARLVSKPSISFFTFLLLR